MVPVNLLIDDIPWFQLISSEMGMMKPAITGMVKPIQTAIGNHNKSLSKSNLFSSLCRELEMLPIRLALASLSSEDKEVFHAQK